MGSTKDIVIHEEPSESRMGRGKFVIRDNFSVFDLKEMIKDTIRYKGAATCMLSAYLFERLHKMGINTHYLGLVDNGKIISVEQTDKPLDEMAIEVARIITPDYDSSTKQYNYDIFRNLAGNYLLPIEVIYRNGLPQGSSVFRRLDKKEITPEDMGLTEMPKEGIGLPKPFIDVSTKLERSDRYIGWNEAARISGLSNRDIVDITERAYTVDNFITEIMEEIGLENWDGKFEFVFDATRKLKIADTIGGLDELRLIYNGIHMSKELARQYYKAKQPELLDDIDKAKIAAEKQGEEDWREYMLVWPMKMDRDFKEILSNMYMAVTDAVLYNGLGKKLFGAPSIREVVREYNVYTMLAL